MSEQTDADKLRQQSLDDATTFIIMKASRLPNGSGFGYCGPTCTTASVQPGKQYDTVEDAEYDAALLSAKNPAGFSVWGATFDAYAEYPETLLGLPVRYVNRDEFSKVSNVEWTVSEPLKIQVRFEYAIESERLAMNVLSKIETEPSIEFIVIEGMKYIRESND